MPRTDLPPIVLPETVTDLRWTRLPEDLIAEAEAIGYLRWLLAVQRGQSSSFDDATSEAAHKMGAVGEAAFCFRYGIGWDRTVDGYTEIPDVAPDIEVRTASRWSGLKVRTARKDPPKRRVTFVLHKPDSEWWYVSGLWIKAGVAQKRYPKTDPGAYGSPAHFVPKADLEPFISIPDHTSHAYQRDDAGYYCLFGGERWTP